MIDEREITEEEMEVEIVRNQGQGQGRGHGHGLQHDEKVDQTLHSKVYKGYNDGKDRTFLIVQSKSSLDPNRN
jgi:hypothetical protein